MEPQWQQYGLTVCSLELISSAYSCYCTQRMIAHTHWQYHSKGHSQECSRVRAGILYLPRGHGGVYIIRRSPMFLQRTAHTCNKSVYAKGFQLQAISAGRWLPPRQNNICTHTHTLTQVPRPHAHTHTDRHTYRGVAPHISSQATGVLISN